MPQVQDYYNIHTSEFYHNSKPLPKRFDEPSSWKYTPKKQHPLFTTTNNSYGSYKPSVHEMPTEFHGVSQKFSEHLSTAGNYRNYSLNTAK